MIIDQSDNKGKRYILNDMNEYTYICYWKNFIKTVFVIDAAVTKNVKGIGD
jgi:hypothetical protein